MTWNGLQGFQTPIVPETFHVQNMGTYGNMHTERGLTCMYLTESRLGNYRRTSFSRFQMLNFITVGI